MSSSDPREEMALALALSASLAQSNDQGVTGIDIQLNSNSEMTPVILPSSTPVIAVDITDSVSPIPPTHPAINGSEEGEFECADLGANRSAMSLTNDCNLQTNQSASSPLNSASGQSTSNSTKGSPVTTKALSTPMNGAPLSNGVPGSHNSCASTSISDSSSSSCSKSSSRKSTSNNNSSIKSSSSSSGICQISPADVGELQECLRMQQMVLQGPSMSSNGKRKAVPQPNAGGGRKRGKMLKGSAKTKGKGRPAKGKGKVAKVVPPIDRVAALTDVAVAEALNLNSSGTSAPSDVCAVLARRVLTLDFKLQAMLVWALRIYSYFAFDLNPQSS